MANLFKEKFLKELAYKYGKPKKLSGSLSLFDLGNSPVRIYIRYSKIHANKKTFFGIRYDDLKQLEGQNSIICFLWDIQNEPVFIPYVEFEDVFNELTPASDGQYKVQIYLEGETELYIANAGRFNIEGFYGWHNLENLIDKSNISAMPELSHSQIQTIIGSIGHMKGYDVWVPLSDRSKLDWDLSIPYKCKESLPSRYGKVDSIVKEIDVIWIIKGSSNLRAIFEVEHSTPIYSGLLRFNDLHLVEPDIKLKFNIVSNYLRRSLFLRQINRPTFKSSGLSDICNFMEYKDVYHWFKRASEGK